MEAPRGGHMVHWRLLYGHITKCLVARDKIGNALCTLERPGGERWGTRQRVCGVELRSRCFKNAQRSHHGRTGRSAIRSAEGFWFWVIGPLRFPTRLRPAALHGSFIGWLLTNLLLFLVFLFALSLSSPTEHDHPPRKRRQLGHRWQTLHRKVPFTLLLRREPPRHVAVVCRSHYPPRRGRGWG